MFIAVSSPIVNNAPAKLTDCSVESHTVQDYFSFAMKGFCVMIIAFWRLLRLTWQPRFRFRLILSQVLLLVSATTTIGIAFSIQDLINNGMVAGDIEVVISVGFTMFILAVIAGITMAGAASQGVFFSQGVGYIVRSRLYDKLQSFSFPNFDKYPTGELMVRLNADVINIQNGILYTVMLLLYAPFMLVVTVLFVAATTPDLIWILVVVIAVVLALMAVIVPQMFRAFEQRQQRLDDVNNAMQENLIGVRVVKAFVREDYEIERFKTRANTMRTPANVAAFRVAFLNPLLLSVTQIAIMLTYYAGGTQVLEGTGMDVGQVASFTQYLSLVIMPLAILANIIPYILRADTSARRVFEVYDQEPIIQDKDTAKPQDLNNVKGKIEFNNVSFAFRKADGTYDPPALKNINLTIEAGQQIGFLGATGAGKSALVNLIPRFYDVTEGSITIDGVDVRDIPQDNLRQIVGIALQEAVLFQGDVRFNLKFGNPAVEDEVMQNAARAADSYGFVNNLPEQWEAPVARRGNNFSGGQRQRLAITRALTQQPRILILDDSTSALDASTEGRVQAEIPNYSENTTILYVAQRISAVIDLDNIVLLENGEIVAMGNHDHLLKTSHLYQEIYESQLGAGMTDGIDGETQ